MIDTSDLRKIGDDKVPAIGMGTWGIGGYLTPDYSKDSEQIYALKKGIEMGLKLIDTAEMYGGGHAEEIVGKAIKDFPREEVFIVSKVLPSNLQRNRLIKSVMMSLKRLETSYIDLYLIHWYEPYVNLKEAMKTLERLVDLGYIRYIGVSNFDVRLVEEARSYLSKYDVVANQVKFSLLSRDVERDLPFYWKEKITIMAYSPLERGILAKNRILSDVGRKYNKSAAQIALNWVICHRGVVAIPKSEKVERLKEFAETMGWRLSVEDFLYLSKKFG